MERQIPLVAKTNLSYAGREFKAGDVFLAKPIDAAVFTYRRRAKFAPSDAEPTPEPETFRPAKREEIELTEDGERMFGGVVTPAEETQQPESGSRRRRYRRRDLKAEE